MRNGVPRQANQNSQQEQSLVRLSSRLRQGERHATGSITPSYDINLCLVCCQTSKAVHKQNLSEKITKEYQGPITLQVSGSNMTTLPHPPSELGAAAKPGSSPGRNPFRNNSANAIAARRPPRVHEELVLPCVLLSLRPGNKRRLTLTSQIPSHSDARHSTRRREHPALER